MAADEVPCPPLAVTPGVTERLFTLPSGMDPELAALTICLSALHDLPPATQARACAYLADRFPVPDELELLTPVDGFGNHVGGGRRG